VAGIVRRQETAVYLFIIPFCAILLFPFVVMFVSALKTNAEIFTPADEFRFLPIQPQWGNFLSIREQVPEMGRFFLNSAVIAFGATALAVAAALPAAYALSRLRFRGRRPFLYLVMVTQMFSPIIIIIGVYKIFADTPTAWISGIFHFDGPNTLIDNLFGLILVNAAFNLAFAIWLLTGYFAGIPKEIEEAAWVDGCSWICALRRILIPLAAPGIVTAVIFVFIAAWNEFIFALTLLSTPEKKPVIVGLFRLVGAYEVQWNYVMVGALYAVVPVVLLFWIAERHLVGGLTAGAVK
jgi:multiple sugar transport system permease protein